MNVNFDSAPPIYIPLCFFLLASLFAICASFSLFAESYILSLFSLDRAAIIHLFTIGFFMTTMLGALFQILPVVIGVNILKQNTVAISTAVGITVGCILLFISFKENIKTLPIAMSIVIASVALIIISALTPIFNSASKSHTKNAITLALACLIVTIFFGFLNGYKYFSPDLSSYTSLKELHIVWGLLGWIPLLIMGVSYQVIPMFHVCPNYPSKPAFILPATIFISLVLISTISLVYGLAIYSFFMGVYSFLTLNILAKRKRKVFDPTVRFWVIGIISLLAAIICAWCSYLYEHRAILQVALILQLFGFAGSVILGMQHKIIPFLVFMHLQKKCFEPPYPIMSVPQMNEILPKSLGKTQSYCHLAWLILLCIACLYENIIFYAGLTGIINFSLLSYCVIRGLTTYNKTMISS